MLIKPISVYVDGNLSCWFPILFFREQVAAFNLLRRWGTGLMLLVSARAMSTGNLIWHWCCVCASSVPVRGAWSLLCHLFRPCSPLWQEGRILAESGRGSWWNHLTGVLISCVFGSVSVNVNVCFCNSDIPPALWSTLSVSDTWPRPVCSTTWPYAWRIKKSHAGFFLKPVAPHLYIECVYTIAEWQKDFWY